MTDDLVAIKQIIPAEGWYALYEQGDDVNYDRYMLACWALVQRRDPSTGRAYDMVEGMITIDYGVESAETSNNFACYCHESQLDQYMEAKDE